LRAVHLDAHDFRNLRRLALDLPAEGAVFFGDNGHGKTSLLEAMYYPVLLRSVRGARDGDLVRRGEAGFFVRLVVASATGATTIEAGFGHGSGGVGRQKRVAVDGAPLERLTDALGAWIAVAFLPSDVELVSGGAAIRRQFLDRMLCLADGEYLRALRRYRAALDQRNAALRQGQPAAAWAFDPLLAKYGAMLVARRQDWVSRSRGPWAETCSALGEPMPVFFELTGDGSLGDPAAWPDALGAARVRDQQHRVTGLGPHRDDLSLTLDRAPLRVIGSTGQQRTAAIALKLCERDTLAQAAGQAPALLLDDVFAELDRDRQDRLAHRLGLGPDSGQPVRPQVFVTAPRADELPPLLDLPVYRVEHGAVSPAGLGAISR